jgi:hypothetical protein
VTKFVVVVVVAVAVVVAEADDDEGPVLNILLPDEERRVPGEETRDRGGQNRRRISG